MYYTISPAETFTYILVVDPKQILVRHIVPYEGHEIISIFYIVHYMFNSDPLGIQLYTRCRVDAFNTKKKTCHTFTSTPRPDHQ